MKSTLLLIALPCFCTFSPPQSAFDHPPIYQTQDAEQGVVEIQIQQVRNREGMMRVAFYVEEEGFPYAPKHEFEFAKDATEDGVLTISMKLPLGAYAFTLLDDENNNGEMDNNWVGLPKEGFAFSNNAGRRKLTMPGFEACQFRLEDPKTLQVVQMRYL
ncbi:DUF2141 domain-containing protein [Pontibacter sp. G13]|uniref:DUF2141 domain-containing protein n=1 Tax=Pontibacter sp. G13 TaxID=3074898 RepID=UPI002889AA80|nr:DUF2141 domain-containing protein [Pontibacter sp. G13]WNJ20341.1 DUF2141 domain-containing protein [Pontibacter sp. G13]